MAGFPILPPDVLSNALAFRGGAIDDDEDDEHESTAAPALIATTQTNTKPKETHMQNDPKRLAKLREIQARQMAASKLAAATPAPKQTSHADIYKARRNQSTGPKQSTNAGPRIGSAEYAQAIYTKRNERARNPLSS